MRMVNFIFIEMPPSHALASGSAGVGMLTEPELESAVYGTWTVNIKRMREGFEEPMRSQPDPARPRGVRGPAVGLCAESTHLSGRAPPFQSGDPPRRDIEERGVFYVCSVMF